MQLSVDLLTTTLQGSAAGLNVPGLPSYGGSSSAWAGGGVALEQYPWGGHAANYGPHNNRLGAGYGVGLGVNMQARTGLRYGSKAKITFADGTVLHRTVNETSERQSGVEFFSNKRGEYERHGKVLKVEPDVTMNFHIHSNDPDAVVRAIRDRSLGVAAHIHNEILKQYGSTLVA